MRTVLFSLFISLVISSCTIDEKIIPIVGIYRAHVIGVAGPFDLVVSTHRGDNLLFEAPFDGVHYAIIEVDIDHPEKTVADIDILKQSIYSDETIRGDGFFSHNTIEIEYCIKYNGKCENYKLIASK